MKKLSEIRSMSLLERLSYNSKMLKNGCIVWTGYVEKTGYATMRFKGNRIKVHRASWIAHNGDIPDGLLILHKCDNRKCINPDHLFIGTQQDNMDDMKTKGRDNRVGVKGSKNHNTNIDEVDVKMIRQRFIDGESRKTLMCDYQLGKTTLQSILSNKSWKHVQLGSETALICQKGYAKKLTADDVRYIRKNYKNPLTRQQAANKFGVSPGNIDLIIANKIWTDA